MISATHRHPLRPPTHPGAFFRQIVLPGLGLTRTDVARALQISPRALRHVLDERSRVTPDMAIRLGKLCGDGPEIWLAMQTERDLWEAKARVDVSSIPTLSAA